MTLFQAILLGIVQGATEFLPVSSSGHLVLVPHILAWQIPAQEAFVFDVLVQLGTLAAVILYFRRDLADITLAWTRALTARRPFSTPNALLGWYLLLATLPALIFGLLLKDQVEAAFDRPVHVAGFLLATAALLLLAEFAGKPQRPLTSLGWLDALLMGLFQVLALFPGVSRSGATITGGMLRGLDRPAAARFSFLMSVPVMLAAGALALLDLFAIPDLAGFLPVMLAGFLTAAAVGYLSIRWLLAFLARRSLIPFSIYLIMVSLIFWMVYA